jgi:hypothetical protein
VTGAQIQRGRPIRRHADALVAQHAEAGDGSGRTWPRVAKRLKARLTFKTLYQREG